MDNIAIQQFKRDFIIKEFVQLTQFEQWLKSLFFLNSKLSNKYDFIYQEAFYIKIYEVFTAGLEYANKSHTCLTESANQEKRTWYFNLVAGLNNLKSELSESEFDYIEYRRHSASHIFQNQYEHIQDNLKIKKERKYRNLAELNAQITALISFHGNDKNVDDYLNKKINPKLNDLYLLLTKK